MDYLASSASHLPMSADGSMSVLSLMRNMSTEFDSLRLNVARIREDVDNMRNELDILQRRASDPEPHGEALGPSQPQRDRVSSEAKSPLDESKVQIHLAAGSHEYSLILRILNRGIAAWTLLQLFASSDIVVSDFPASIRQRVAQIIESHLAEKVMSQTPELGLYSVNRTIKLALRLGLQEPMISEIVPGGRRSRIEPPNTSGPKAWVPWLGAEGAPGSVKMSYTLGHVIVAALIRMPVYKIGTLTHFASNVALNIAASNGMLPSDLLDVPTQTPGVQAMRRELNGLLVGNPLPRSEWASCFHIRRVSLRPELRRVPQSVSQSSQGPRTVRPEIVENNEPSDSDVEPPAYSSEAPTPLVEELD